MYLRNNDLLNNAITCTLKLSGIHTPEEMTERKYVLPIILSDSTSNRFHWYCAHFVHLLDQTKLANT